VGDIRGGDSFSDIYGVRSFLIRSLPVLSVIWVRGSVVLFPQTYGPFSHAPARFVARYILRHASRILSRDRASIQTVTDLIGPTTRIGFCPDVAFALEPRPHPQPQIEPPLPDPRPACLVGFNINGLMYHSRRFGLKLDYPSFVKKMLVALAAQGVCVLLVPHTLAPAGDAESDPEASREALRELSPAQRIHIHLATDDYDQHQVKALIGRCDFFVGSRMHACFAALSQGVPTVGVAYSKKFEGGFGAIGLAEWVVDGRTVDADAAVAQVVARLQSRNAMRIQLHPKPAEARQLLDLAFRDLLAAPVRSGPFAPATGASPAKG
jgi:polysaccharide pyruvyl transferase WcaK-like protein